MENEAVQYKAYEELAEQDIFVGDQADWKN